MNYDEDKNGLFFDSEEMDIESTKNTEEKIEEKKTDSRHKQVKNKEIDSASGLKGIINKIPEGSNTMYIIAAVVACVIVVGLSVFFITKSNMTKHKEAAINEAKARAEINGDYPGAMDLIDQNIKYDKDGQLAELKQQYLNNFIAQRKAEAQIKIQEGDYVAASGILEEAARRANGSDESLDKLYNTCVTFMGSIQPWDGDVEHVFFHTLISDPAATFNGDYQTEDFDDYFVTVDEFKRLLNRFYESGYILFDIHELYSVNPDGSVSPVQVYVPAGKKPLVMSFDDVCYYDYMKPYNFVSGMEVAEDGSVVTYRTLPDGSKQVVPDGDFVPIVEEFVAEHPDFSFNGARGTIALTGYEGVFGYRTNELDAPDYAQRVEAAKAVADRLKELGWTFASHSYGHMDYTSRDDEWYANDDARWNAEVAPIIGGTDIYIYPHGTNPADWTEPKHQTMLSYGFKIFCGVYQLPGLEYHDNFVYMERRNIDGISFREDRLTNMIDMTGIVDINVRPQREPAYH